MERLGKCARGGSGNACRNLHRMLTDEKLSLPVSISIIDVPIKEPHRKCSRIVGWPVLRLSDWARCALGRAGHMLLAGHCLEDEPAWRMELKMFWDRYSLIDGEHPLFSSGIDTAATIPFMIHGDEGRGRNKLPLLTISFQGILSHYGSHRLNMSGFRSCIIRCFKLSTYVFRGFCCPIRGIHSAAECCMLASHHSTTPRTMRASSHYCMISQWIACLSSFLG